MMTILNLAHSVNNYVCKFAMLIDWLWLFEQTGRIELALDEMIISRR